MHPPTFGEIVSLQKQLSPIPARPMHPAIMNVLSREYYIILYYIHAIQSLSQATDVHYIMYMYSTCKLWLGNITALL